MSKIKKTPHYSYLIGEMPRGCQFCVRGSKEVIFLTGLCAIHCPYCPVSDTKWQIDRTWADEWCIEKDEDIITEAKLINAKGAGFTGGDPLTRIERCVKYIKMLKKEFGEHFHIHLYTPLELVDKDKLKQLYDAGLDEIRFHLDVYNDKLWDKINLALRYDWDIGIEIPAIPTKYDETIKLIAFIKDKVKFLNINELEISDANACKLGEMGFMTKDHISYGIKGSEELALKLLDYCSKNTNLNVHYCTTTLKDKVQLGNRLKRRAKNIAKPFDVVKEDGTLVRGAIYLKSLKPGFGYRRKLKELTKEQKQEALTKLEKLREDIKKQHRIRDDLLFIDKLKLRLLTSVKKLKKIDKSHCRAIIREYPTHDQMEVELEFLK